MHLIKRTKSIFASLSVLFITLSAQNSFAQSKTLASTNSLFKMCNINVQQAILQTNEGKLAKSKKKKKKNII